jgi:hypothetical protein
MQEERKEKTIICPVFDPLRMMGDGTEKGGSFLLWICSAIALPFIIAGAVLKGEWPDDPDD